MNKLLSSLSSITGIATNNDNNDQAITTANELLRGELSAVETYLQVIEGSKSEPETPELSEFLVDHQFAVDKLSDFILRRNGTPSTSSGVWGFWAKTVTGSAKLFGDTAALSALKEGEVHGRKEYDEALDEGNLPTELSTDISEILIPNQLRHITKLDLLIDRA